MTSKTDPFGIAYIIHTEVLARGMGEALIDRCVWFADAVIALFPEEETRTILAKIHDTDNWLKHCTVAAEHARAHGIPDDTIRFLVALHLK
jgi:hypothetical protein